MNRFEMINEIFTKTGDWVLCKNLSNKSYEYISKKYNEIFKKETNG